MHTNAHGSRAPTPLTYDILVALADAERHGYGIIREIEERSGERHGAAARAGA